MEILLTVALVGVYGGVGSVIRHLASYWMGFLPWGTLLVNVTGALVAGLALGVDFWMPRNKYGVKPKIEIYWSNK